MPSFRYRAARLTALLLIGLVSLPACKKPEPLRLGELVVEHQTPLSWTALEPGLDFARLEYRSTTEEGRVVLAALRIDPARFSFALLNAPDLLGTAAGSIEEMAAKIKPLAAVNASFYLPESYLPIGLVVAAGKVENPWKKAAGSGIFWSRGGEAALEWARDYRAAWERSDLAIQAGPFVVEPGGRPGIVSNTRKYRARTAVGLDSRRRVTLVCTLREDEGEELRGLDLYELMEIMAAPESRGGLGQKAAVNLDGGTSTAMLIDLPQLNLHVASLHPIRNGIAVFRRR
jgi:uncharacterized protein YigE (DUF2233 family)